MTKLWVISQSVLLIMSGASVVKAIDGAFQGGMSQTLEGLLSLALCIFLILFSDEYFLG